MAAKKLDKALYGPSVTEVALGAVLGLLVGVVVAVVFLVFKPVVTVKELPKELSRTAVYFVPGSTPGAGDWTDKQKQFLAGAAITVSEADLNAWAAASTASLPDDKAAKAASKPGEKTKPGDPAAAAANPGFVVPSAPNFRIVGEKLQIGTKITFNWFGLTCDVTAQATGSFRQAGDEVAFVPDTAYLGSCPLHMLPGASGLLFSQLLSKQKFSDEMRLAWTKVREVSIGDGSVKLAVQ